MPRKKRAKGSLTISLSELSQEVDLEAYIGRKPTESEKTAFAEIAKATIESRTLDGKTVNGGRFKKYSKEYADFKGVTRDSVDLFLDGDMLDGIGRRKSKEKKSTIFLQMKKGLQTKKGFNHTSGDTVPKREFFGLTDMEAKQIAEEIKQSEQVNESSNLSLSALRNILGELDIEQVE